MAVKPYTYSWNEGITADSPALRFTRKPITYICNITDQCNYKKTDSNFSLSCALLTFHLLSNLLLYIRVILLNSVTQAKVLPHSCEFGDGDTSGSYLLRNRQYGATGTYLVVLTAYNNSGCKDTADRISM